MIFKCKRIHESYRNVKRIVRASPKEVNFKQKKITAEKESSSKCVKKCLEKKSKASLPGTNNQSIRVFFSRKIKSTNSGDVSPEGAAVLSIQEDREVSIREGKDQPPKKIQR